MTAKACFSVVAPLQSLSEASRPSGLSCPRFFGGSPLQLRGANNRAVVQASRKNVTGLVKASLAGVKTELDLVSSYSEVVPDTVVGDDFQGFAPTAATVSSSLLLGLSGLPDARFDGAIKNALAYGQCMVDTDVNSKFSCFLDKALVNVGAELLQMVPGKVSTEVDPRLSHDTQALMSKVRRLVQLYAEVEVSTERLLFKLPATWEGIEAARQLEDDGIKTHITCVNSFAQAAASAQAKAAVVQISVGRIRDWARTNSGDPEVDVYVQKGEDPALSMVTNAFNYVVKSGLPTKVMASNLRTKEDVLQLLGVHYVIVPVKVLESLMSTPAIEGTASGPAIKTQDDNSTLFSSASNEPWTEERFEKELGKCARDILQSEIEGAVAQAKRVEEHFQKIWPPPNV